MKVLLIHRPTFLKYKSKLMHAKLSNHENTNNLNTNKYQNYFKEPLRYNFNIYYCKIFCLFRLKIALQMHELVL